MPDTPEVRQQDIYEVHPFYMLQWEEKQQANFLLYPEGIIKLNETAAEILKHCTGEKPVQQVVDDLKEIFLADDPQTEERIEQGVYKFLEESHAKGWIRRK